MAASVRQIFCRGSFNLLSGKQVIPAISTCQQQTLVHQYVRHRSTDTESTSPLTLVDHKSGIRTITLNNPKKRNALSLAMLEALLDNISHNVDDEALRAIVIRSTGPVFSSGHDLKELTSDYDRAYHTKVFDKCTELMQTIQDITVPVVAEVAGLATAAGCQLVASCDVAIASEKAMFATPGVNVGLFCSTPGVALSRAVPRKVAMSMLLTGDPISAHDALTHGLVSKVVTDDRLQAETQRVTERICETSRVVVALGKACFYSQVQLDRNTAYRQASQVMVGNLELADGQEGIRAFLEKRRPHWCHNARRHNVT